MKRHAAACLFVHLVLTSSPRNRSSCRRSRNSCNGRVRRTCSVLRRRRIRSRSPDNGTESRSHGFWSSESPFHRGAFLRFTPKTHRCPCHYSRCPKARLRSCKRAWLRAFSSPKLERSYTENKKRSPTLPLKVVEIRGIEPDRRTVTSTWSHVSLQGSRSVSSIHLSACVRTDRSGSGDRRRGHRDRRQDRRRRRGR